jgi:hypothetical protein
VLFFACSDRLLWHACEAKPYALDVLLATAVLYGYHASRTWRLGRRLALYVLASPLLIFLSYPGCFLCGGLLVAEMPAVLRERKWSAILGYFAWASVIAVSFLLLLLGPIRAQQDSELASCWQGMFPDWDRPWLVPWWIVDNTLQVVHYAVSPIGEFAGVACAGSAWLLWRRGYRSRLVVLIVPVGLALAAACLHKYPYGRSRVMAYAAPAAVLLLADGLHSLWLWLRSDRPVLAWPLGVVMALPLANTAWRVVQPWARADTANACAYVMQHIQPGEECVGSSWEMEYYFRQLPADCHFASDPAPPVEKTIWLVVLSLSPAEREAVLAAYRAQRTLLEVREFNFVTVAHLAPVRQQAGQPPPRCARLEADGRQRFHRNGNAPSTGQRMPGWIASLSFD